MNDRNRSHSQDGISEPADVKLHSTFGSSDISRILRVPGLIVVPVQRYTYFAFLRRAELSVVQSCRSGVAHDESFAHNPRLSRGMSLSRCRVDAASSRGIDPSAITLDNLLLAL